MKRTRIRVDARGVVQGVGFRPFVYGLAARFGLSGWVLNDEGGASLEVEGDDANALDAFCAALTAEAPPLARIDRIVRRDVAAADDPAEGFVVRESRRCGRAFAGVAPDAAVCPACLAELFDPGDRRFGYAFINCTDCGPRYSILRRLPYDRPQTTMAAFAMCPDCAREYADPSDRRFHAQPVACPACGPRLNRLPAEAAACIAAGGIVALKGLGGFHLACDARNDAAVDRLRRRKRRDGKPFAVMVAGTAAAERCVVLDDDERALLESSARPIVLARRRPDAPPVAAAVAPGLAQLGVALPSTPLHYLLFHELAGRPNGVAWLNDPSSVALVMTSANPGGEPPAIDDAEAVRRLAGIADAIVGHDREIAARLDDSVMRKIAGAPAFIRRARGFTPRAVRLPHALPPMLATGGDLKNAVCVVRGDEAFPSQHVGDLDDAATLDFLAETVDRLLDVLEIEPQIVAHDLHPDFQSTRFALRFAAGRGIPAAPVQHHHAHVAAVAAENGVVGPALGLALDGYGMGEDGEAWGGEMLVLDGAGGYARVGAMAALAMPGGDAAARQPWRMAAAALHRLGRGDEIPARFAAFGPAEGVRRMLDASAALSGGGANVPFRSGANVPFRSGANVPFRSGVNVPFRSGVNVPFSGACGRWFDAACGLLGIKPTAGYEAEAPATLESLVRRPVCDGRPWTIDGENRLDPSPLLDRISYESDPAAGADLFHGGIVAALIDWTLPQLRARDMDRVILSGGCLLNAVLAGGLRDGFEAAGVRPLFARRVPTGDGGLALGQAWAAGLRSLNPEPQPPPDAARIRPPARGRFA